MVQRAREAGTTPEEYARQLIEDGLSRKVATFDEILAPFRREVKESGMTDTELDELFTRARKEVFRKRREQKKT